MIVCFLDKGRQAVDIASLIMAGEKIEKPDMKTKGVNTEPNYFSLKRWHGADWQHRLPQMYLPRKEKYDAYNSHVVRLKKVHARFRDSSEMFCN